MKKNVRNIFILLFLSIPSFYFAQLKNITEQNEKGIILTLQDFNFQYKDEHKNNFIIRDYYQFNDPGQAGRFKLPFKVVTVALPPNVHPVIKVIEKQENTFEGIIPALQRGVKLNNDSTLAFVDYDYKNITTFNDEDQLLGTTSYFWLKGVYCIQFKIHSHLFDSKTNQLHVLNRIKINLEFANNSFFANSKKEIKYNTQDSLLSRYIYNYGYTSQLNPQNLKAIKDSSYDWLDFNSPHIKYSIAANTIFRIYKKDLVDNGLISSTVDPRTFKLFESGKEVPITIKGQEDGTFDNGDYIEFTGGMNYPKKSYRIINADTEEYNEYLNRYTDSLYFFLTWGNKPGKRVPVQNSILISNDTLAYYMQNDHYEKNIMLQNLNGDELANQNPDWNKNKTWYSDWLFTNASYTVKISNIYKNKSANIYFKSVSAGSNITARAHQLLFKFNGVKIDSQSIDRYKQVVLKGTVDSNSLIEGNNQISVTNIANGSSPNYLGIDWYDIEYPRQLIAQNDSLIFTLDPKLDKKIRIVKIKNVVTTDFVLYKSKPVVKKIESFQKNGTNLIFSDTTSGGDQYCLIPVHNINSPQFIYKKNFINLRNSSNHADYIAITHSNFLSSVQVYTSSISTLYNVMPIVVNISDIFDEFSFGYPYPEAIKSFLIAASSSWGSPKPKNVVLIGDADYDYKKFRFKNDGVIGGGNFVPSYGFPVSDYWFTVWDNNSFIPQLAIGRLPINSALELNRYADKVRNNFNNPFTDWNKKYIFFSGGNGSSADELTLFKSTNDTVISKFIKPVPVGGNVNHFYKTANPQSDFGPITSDQFNSAIDQGAVIISYLGHSGTATWDNSINDITQLKNKQNRNPLILDFGCSTAKFAEPDVVCFGERFILDANGQAISYIGNSSLGFVSTSTFIPQKFFELLSLQPSLSIGELMLNTKQTMLLTYGNTSLSRIFVLTNSLLGDPVIKLKIPQKTNLYLDQNSFLSKDNVFNENNDSTQVKYQVQNLGRADLKNYQINFAQKFNGGLISGKNISRPLPLLYDTLSFWIKTKNYPGQHTIDLVLDPLNQIDEIYKNDNNLTSLINVYSSSLRDLLTNVIENSLNNSFNILNPAQNINKQFNIIFEIADNNSFQNSSIKKFPAGQMFTKITLSNLLTNKRYWFHYKMDDVNSQNSPDKSFYYTNTPAFLINDQYSFTLQKYVQTAFSSNSIQLGIDTLDIKAFSAGTYAGSTCVISKNGLNLLVNNYFAGIGIVVFDETTLNMDYSDWYQLFNDPARMQQLVNYLNSIPEKKIVVLGVSDDAANNISLDLKNALKSLGSTKIDSLKFQGSWAMIGKRNSKPGEVVEKVAGPYNGSVLVEKKYSKQFDTGKMITQKIGPVSSWKKLYYTLDAAGTQLIKFRPIAIDKNGKTDTLAALQINNGIADLSQIDPGKYPFMQMQTEFTSAQGISPILKSVGVDYAGAAELGTNYQGVTLDKDTLELGEKANLSFNVYNAGSARAENFKVIVDAINKDNVHAKIFEQLVDSIGIGQSRLFTTSYSSVTNTGKVQLVISIDSANSITEMFKDNNSYSVPIFIKSNTKPAALRLTFDGNDIMNGDYISSSPHIKIELNDQSLLTITDTNAVKIILNNKRIYFLNNPAINYSFSSSNPKLSVDYRPSLSSGTYILKVVGSNAGGQVIDTNGVQRKFSVQNELQVSEVYNYPNPFAVETYFTFKLTQIPDEVRIKIFTVAGRIIKEIRMNSFELKYDFNKIYWDGRDNDGDNIANGVYIYKLISVKGSETVTATQKLVKMK